ncbi:hypothetical protein DBB34_01695 [Sphaerisporangium cinnabarinum]|nr:hypothetical protein [Sphaerisporangium cinnabarinum]PTU57861.1 hypothetical protein DBB34_01695 [Sphaerisporangium cinnabarinum]
MTTENMTASPSRAASRQNDAATASAVAAAQPATTSQRRSRAMANGRASSGATAPTGVRMPAAAVSRQTTTAWRSRQTTAVATPARSTHHRIVRTICPLVGVGPNPMASNAVANIPIVNVAITAPTVPSTDHALRADAGRRGRRGGAGRGA